jgi:Excalibur calcium-binding domain
MTFPTARTVIAAVILVGGAVGVAQAASDGGTIRYQNCKALNARYPHGVGRFGARDHTSGTPPVTNFRRSNRLYRQNKARDRDGDGIACEKR